MKMRGSPIVVAARMELSSTCTKEIPKQQVRQGLLFFVMTE